MATALPLAARSDLAGYVQAMRDDGYAYFPGVLNREEIAALRQAMDELTAIEASFDRHTDPKKNGFLNKSINTCSIHIFKSSDIISAEFSQFS